MLTLSYPVIHVNSSKKYLSTKSKYEIREFLWISQTKSNQITKTKTNQTWANESKQWNYLFKKTKFVFYLKLCTDMYLFSPYWFTVHPARALISLWKVSNSPCLLSEPNDLARPPVLRNILQFFYHFDI